VKRRLETEDGRTLWQAILDVHSTSMGSYDRDEERQKKDIQFLEDRLNSWCDQGTMSAAFDDNVRGLIIITITEARLNNASN
jgi:ribosomal protein S16